MCTYKHIHTETHVQVHNTHTHTRARTNTYTHKHIYASTEHIHANTHTQTFKQTCTLTQQQQQQKPHQHTRIHKESHLSQKHQHLDTGVLLVAHDVICERGARVPEMDKGKAHQLNSGLVVQGRKPDVRVPSLAIYYLQLVQKVPFKSETPKLL